VQVALVFYRLPFRPKETSVFLLLYTSVPFSPCGKETKVCRFPLLPFPAWSERETESETDIETKRALSIQRETEVEGDVEVEVGLRTCTEVETESDRDSWARDSGGGVVGGKVV
jgi:hypothetical protein